MTLLKGRPEVKKTMESGNVQREKANCARLGKGKCHNHLIEQKCLVLNLFVWLLDSHIIMT